MEAMKLFRSNRKRIRNLHLQTQASLFHTKKSEAKRRSRITVQDKPPYLPELVRVYESISKMHGKG